MSTDNMQKHRLWTAAFMPAAREAIARGDYITARPEDAEHYARVLAQWNATSVLLGQKPQLPMPPKPVAHELRLERDAA